MDRIRVAAPPGIAETLTETWLDVVVWDGRAPVPDDAERADVWVAPYAVGLGREAIASSVQHLPGLRVVQLLSAGVEPWPDVLPDGVTLCSGRGIHGGSTAELAVATTLAVVRELPRYAEQQRLHEWRRHAPDTIAGRRVLVLGAGDIGRRVATVFEALEAEVLLVARRRRPGVLELGDVHAQLPGVDVVVVALPHTEETTGLVDASFLAGLPDGALVVNVARGAIVDTDALTAEVARGRLRAALDVTDPEPLPPDHPLWGLPGVLLTPHVGGGAAGWATRAQRLVADQLGRLHTGAELRNVVTGGY